MTGKSDLPIHSLGERSVLVRVTYPSAHWADLMERLSPVGNYLQKLHNRIIRASLWMLSSRLEGICWENGRLCRIAMPQKLKAKKVKCRGGVRECLSTDGIGCFPGCFWTGSPLNCLIKVRVSHTCQGCWRRTWCTWVERVENHPCREWEKIKICAALFFDRFLDFMRPRN